MSGTNHELFTELSSDQAATVEGGLTVTITKIQCLKAGADGFLGGGDDLYVKGDGGFLHGRTFGMKSAQTRTINLKFFSSRNAAAIDLFDSDTSSQDDFLGGFSANSTGGQVFSKQVSGSGSRYRIFYSAV